MDEFDIFVGFFGKKTKVTENSSSRDKIVAQISLLLRSHFLDTFLPVP